MKSNLKRGFTLVELLVVIAIIGVLVGLLVPAVNYARETARKAECLNNVQGIGKAMLLHETDKSYFPGRVNLVRANLGHEIPVSWMTKLLPYIEQGSVWDLVINDPDTTSPDDPIRYAIALEIATCASDPITSTNNPAPSNYVMNCGIWDRDFGSNANLWNDLRANGIGHVIRNNFSQAKVDIGYIGKNDGGANTILLSENVNAVTWVTLEEGLHGFVWTLQDKWLAEGQQPESGRQYQINKGKDRFLDEQVMDMANSGDVDKLVSLARPSSNHSGGVNAVFCDGHGQYISEEVDALVYAQLMTTARSQARHPLNPDASGSNWKQVPIRTQMNTTLKAGDY